MRTCKCCGGRVGDKLTDEDFSGPGFMQPAIETAMLERFGEYLCYGCANDLRFCDECGKLMTEDEVYQTDIIHGDTFEVCSEDCLLELRYNELMV